VRSPSFGRLPLLRVRPVLPGRRGVAGGAGVIAAALVVGYLVGSAPTADWLARRRGIDLRSTGSGNPGTNNALRTGGPRLAASGAQGVVGPGVAASGRTQDQQRPAHRRPAPGGRRARRRAGQGGGG